MIREPIAFSRATPADAHELADNLRTADAHEMLQTMGFGPADGVALSCFVSDMAIAGRCRGRLLALFGGFRDSVLADTGTIWALGTRAIDASPRDFLRGSRAGLGMVMADLPEVQSFSNWVLESNTASVRWLDWLGAHWSGARLRTPFGGPFRQFTLGRSTCAIQ